MAFQVRIGITQENAQQGTGVAGTDYVVFPISSTYKTTSTTLVDSSRNSKGFIISNVVRAGIRKIELSWRVLTIAEYSLLSKFFNTNFTFYVYYFDQDDNTFECRQCYVGDRVAPALDSKAWVETTVGGETVLVPEYVKDIKLSLIEMQGDVMLAVPNRTTWENYFKQAVISNCNVSLYVGDNATIFGTKDNIVNFKITSRNSYVCEELPSDDCSFELINWSQLPNTTKKELQTKNKIVYIRYTVQGTTTTLFEKIVYIKDCVVDRKEFSAKITCRSYFQDLTRVTLGQANWVGVPALLTPDMTEGEFIQLSALVQRRAVYINRDYNGVFKFKDYDPTTVLGNFDEKNIIDDYQFNFDDERKKNISIFGYKRTSNYKTLYTTTVTTTSANYEFRYTPEKMEDVTQAVIRQGGVSRAMSVSQYTKYKSCHTTNAPIGQCEIEILGYEVALDDVPTSTDYYISTYAFLDGYQGNAQTMYRNYYKNNRFIEFDCRVDPTLEPLDIIETIIDGTKYRLVLEEVTINFNGGFTGHIKGRIIAVLYEAPVIEDLSVRDGVFDIVNNNDVAVSVVITYSGGTITLPIPANSTLHCDISTNVSQLYESFYSKDIGVLRSDVTCHFEATDYISSDNTIILEADQLC